MPVFWRRREVWCGFDVRALAAARQALAEAGIAYRLKNVGHSRAGRRGGGRLGEDPMASHMYYLYVDKKDLERARAALSAGKGAFG